MKTWQETGFGLEFTQDGSPTLRLPGDGESMHHMGGAFAETLEIYAEPSHWVLTREPQARFFSLGLGLGYVEMAVTAAALSLGLRARGETRESEEPLRRAFLSWLKGDLPAGEVLSTYEGLAQRFGVWAQVEPQQIRVHLHEQVVSGDWRLAGAFGPSEPPPEGRFHGICYDAFSSKTSPELWGQDFLEGFFREHAAPESLLTTYACTGNLKRALAQTEFAVLKKSGFQGKKNSTLALRGSWREDLSSFARSGSSSPVLAD